VSLETLRRLGFSSTRSARAAFYRRAKVFFMFNFVRYVILTVSQLLFDFNGESDLLSTAQGTLLLAYNSTLRNYKQVNTFWLGLAIQFAKDADAH